MGKTKYYGEETESATLKVPRSRKPEFMAMARKWLAQFRIVGETCACKYENLPSGVKIRLVKCDECKKSKK